MESVIDALLDRYDAFYLMTRSAAMLGTRNVPQFDADAAALIELIGRAYSWPQALIEGATGYILGEMMRVALTADYLALSSAELLDDVTGEALLLFEIKGRVIEEVNRVETAAATAGTRSEQEVKAGMGYSAFHHAYEPRLRFAQIKKLADAGEPAAMLQEALMRVLGIGCRRDTVAAWHLLQDLLIWGEKAAAAMLAFLRKEEGDTVMRDCYRRIFALLDGTQPAWRQKDTLDDAAEACILIAAVQSFVVRGSGRRDVDRLFAALLNREGLTFSEKLELIRGYKDGNWLRRWEPGKSGRPVGFLSTQERLTIKSQSPTAEKL